MSSTDDYEPKRPRRSCATKELEEGELEDSESEYEIQDDSSDEDFSLKPRKKRPKKKKKEKLEKKPKKNEPSPIPSFSQVMAAQAALEQKYSIRHSTDVNDENYSTDDEQPIKSQNESQEEPQGTSEDTELYYLPPEPTRKKKVVIRPWNPMWYQINH